MVRGLAIAVSISLCAAVSACKSEEDSSSPTPTSGDSGTGTAPVTTDTPTSDPSSPGETSPGATPTNPTSPVRQPATLIGYEFPDGGIKSHKTPESGMMRTRVGGILSVPAGKGPFPVALVLHGSYINCMWKEKENVLDVANLNTAKNDKICPPGQVSGNVGSRGQDYVKHDAAFAVLTQELASRGIAALAIDLSVKDSLSGGESDPTWIQQRLAKLHLGLAKDFNRGEFHGLNIPETVKGKLDLSNQAWIGHSSGGQFVFQSIESGLPSDVKAAVGYQPALNVNSAKPFSRQVPSMILGSLCDEQVGINELVKAKDSLKPALPKAPLVFVQTGSMTHISVIGGGDHTKGVVTPSEDPRCSAGKLVSPEVARTHGASLVADFLGSVLHNKKSIVFRHTDKMAVSAESLNSLASVSTAKVQSTSLAREVQPKSVTYLKSSERILPEYEVNWDEPGDGEEGSGD